MVAGLHRRVRFLDSVSVAAMSHTGGRAVRGTEPAPTGMPWQPACLGRA